MRLHTTVTLIRDGKAIAELPTSLTEMEWKPIEPMEKEQEFTAFRQWLTGQICVLFGVSLQELGITMVEGSVSPVIDDPARLLGEAE